ncbi:MAG: hypothetical protein FJ304_20540 [Planctomycetes bacterium]|nr:hypothetical protein [Planctomycetota bacterium]
MRLALVLAAAVFAAPAVRAADPPITFQTHPLDRLLGDLRAAADLIGGEKAVKSLNAGIREKLGDKGFEGLDVNKPIVGYVILAPKLEDTVAVVAFPVSGEKAFLSFCERWNGGTKPKDLGKGLWEVPELFPESVSRMRFSNGYAYIAAGKKPEAALGEKELVAPDKLYDPAERAVLAGKLHFDRITPDVKKAALGWVAELKKQLEDIGGGPAGAIVKSAFPELEKMFARYFLLMGGADTATLRVGVDVPTSDLVVEATLTPKPDTLLAKVIGDRKATGNRFGALIASPDTVAGFKTRLPFFNAELKEAGVKALEEGQKQAVQNTPEVGKAAMEELFKGLIRTVKTGEADIVAGVRGPDKDGEFAFVAAVAFEDGAALEKEFKKFFKGDAPQNEQDRMKWDAAKVGNTNIHTYKLTTGGFFDISKPFGGEKASLAFAFAPNGIFVTIGPDPVALMKDALAVKPADSPVLDVVLNPKRVAKFVEKTGGQATDIERALGKEDKLLSAMSLRVTGGKELSVKLAINLRLLPRALIIEGGAFDGDKGEPIPGEKRPAGEK